MDSIFEYLILLFFIFSLLNSIFKKKKKTANDGDSDSKVDSTGPSPQKKSRSILEEILKMGMPPEIKENRPSVNKEMEQETNENTWFPEKEFQDVFTQAYREKTIPAPEISVVKKSEPPRQRIKKSEKKSPELFSREFLRIENFKNQIKNPVNLREYILVSEILNKPKALRR